MSHTEGVRIDINKWSPADIYITTKNISTKCLDEEMNFKIESVYDA